MGGTKKQTNRTISAATPQPGEVLSRTHSDIRHSEFTQTSVTKPVTISRRCFSFLVFTNITMEVLSGTIYTVFTSTYTNIHTFFCSV